MALEFEEEDWPKGIVEAELWTGKASIISTSSSTTFDFEEVVLDLTADVEVVTFEVEAVFDSSKVESEFEKIEGMAEA